MEINYLVQNLTLTQLTKWLNDSKEFKKQSKTDFTTNDVSQYIKLGHLPHYMGGNKIDESDTKIPGIKLYNLRK